MTGIDIMYYSLIALGLVWIGSMAFYLYQVVMMARRLRRNRWKP
jgi:hypothetical protein